MKKIILFSILAIILSACIESKIESFTDPDYKNSKFTKIVLDLNSLPETTRLKATPIIMQRLKEGGYDVMLLNDLIAPTRSYEPAQVRELITSAGFDYVLAVNVTGETSNSSLAGIYSHNTTNYSGYNNQVNAQGTTYTTPIYASSGSTSIRATIYNIKNINIAWQATVLSEAAGTAFVGNVSAITHSAIGKIIDQLKIDGHS